MRLPAVVAEPSVCKRQKQEYCDAKNSKWVQVEGLEGVEIVKFEHDLRVKYAAAQTQTPDNEQKPRSVSSVLEARLILANSALF